MSEETFCYSLQSNLKSCACQPCGRLMVGEDEELVLTDLMQNFGVMVESHIYSNITENQPISVKDLYSILCVLCVYFMHPRAGYNRRLNYDRNKKEGNCLT